MSTPAKSRAPWHGGCSECVTADKALNSGIKSLEGGKMETVNIGVSGTGHGTTKAPCSSCGDMLDNLGIEVDK